jgi:hypothetical protein
MRTVNAQIRRWLDAGCAVEAILGESAYRVPSSLYAGEHDLILVLNQLFTWAEDEERAQDAAGAIEAAVSQTSEHGDLAMAYDIVWCYFLISDDRGTRLPLDRRSLLASLAAVEHPADVSAEHVTSVLDRVHQLP